MKPTFTKFPLLFILMITCIFPLHAQIYGPEGLNMPGDWNGWNNPPTNPVFAGEAQTAGGKIHLINLGNPFYQTTFHVIADGGDLTGGTYAFKFTSGPTFNGNNNNIDFFILPKAIGRLYYAKISGLSDTLVDYYVEMTDPYGNIFKTPIQHVFVGNAGNNEDNGSDSNVFWKPQKPSTTDTIIIYSKTAVKGSLLHWGVTVNGKHWTLPLKTYRPAGTTATGTGAVETPFSGPDPKGFFICRLGPFDDPRQKIQQIDFVIKIKEGQWDNNNGKDYYVPVSGTPQNRPSGSDGMVVMRKNSVYIFSSADFGIFDTTSTAGIRLTSLPGKGELNYHGKAADTGITYPVISRLHFIPGPGETGLPYAYFNFKIIGKDSNTSQKIFNMALWVLNGFVPGISWYPKAPLAGDKISLLVHGDKTMDTFGGSLHWGVQVGSDDWTLPLANYRPYGTTLFGDGHAVETPFTKIDSSTWKVILGPFNRPKQTVNAINFVLHYGNGTWNNHEGNNWRIPIYFTGIQNENNKKNFLRIYPNPVKGFKAIIEWQTQWKTPGIIRIINCSGKTVKSFYPGSAHRVVFYPHLPPGIYVVRFINIQTGKGLSRKIIIP